MSLNKSRIAKLEANSSNRAVRYVRASDPNLEARRAELQRQGFNVIVVSTGVPRNGDAP